jgi:hydroxyacylglutathione hydrolase
VEEHVRAVSSAVADAELVSVLVTHGHGDHADAAAEVARRTGAPVFGAGPVERPLADGDSIQTDAGPLVAVETPGHAREHLCFHWPARKALFAGDLILGAGDTTWVAGYPGCVADYFTSLERLRSLGLRRIYPAHGDDIDDVNERLDRFEAHRRHRIAQVEAILRERPEATRRQILHRVYGPKLPPSLERAAFASLDAILDYLAGEADKDAGPG